MSYSLLAKQRRRDFEGKGYKKLLKWVYYYGRPANGRQEYFAMDHPALEWIRQSIHLNLSTNLVLDKKNDLNRETRRFQPGVLSLDYYIINWEITFHLCEDKCWFIGPVYMNARKILLRTVKRASVLIVYNEEAADSDIFELRTIKFTGPLPNLQSIITEGDTTYILNVKWDNSMARILGRIENYEEIVVKKYTMYVDNRLVII